MSLLLLAVALSLPPAALHPRAAGLGLRALAADDPEAARAALWLEGIDPRLVALDLAPGCERLVLATFPGPSFPVSTRLAEGLAALSAHFEAVDRSRQAPVAAAEAERALRRPETPRQVSAAFAAAAVAPGLRFEPGGVAYLEDPGDPPRLVLIAVDDPVHSLAREVLALRDRPSDIPPRLRRNLLHGLALDPNGLLAAFFERHPPGQAYDARAWRGLDLALSAIAANVADSYGMDDETLARAIVRARPRGRYLGWWHGHPGPGAEPPSEEDRRVALAEGRFLTFAERDFGYEAWDVSADRPQPPAIRLAHPAPKSPVLH